MTYLDLIAIAIIGFSTLIAYKRGLLKTLFGLGSTIIGIVIAYLIYPILSSWIIKNTGFYGVLQDKIGKGLKLENAAQVVSPQDKIEFINALELPQFIKKILINNNNSEVYRLLDVSDLKEYVVSVIAKIALNAIVFILVLIIASIAIKLILNALDIITKLPVIHQMNQLGGLLLGAVWGVIVVYILCIILSVSASFQKDEKLLLQINNSPVIEFFNNHNLLMDQIDSIADGKNDLSKNE